MELRDLEIEFISLHDIEAKTPEQEVMQKMQGVFHDYERVKIAERFRRGKLGKTRSGKLLGYQASYGYDYIPKTKEQNGSFIINEDEAEVVKKIFNWVGNQGYSTREVIKKLYDLKIYPKKKKRDFWTKSPLTRLLQNETYIGKHFYYKTEAVVPKNPKSQNGLNGKYKKIKKCSRKMRPKEEWIPYQCPAIIDEELFNKVQNQLKLNYKYAKRNRKYDYLLSGLIKCTCGTTRVGEQGRYYRCANRIYNYPLPPTCHIKGINSQILDDLVYDKVLKLVTNKGLLIKQAERRLSLEQLSNIVGDDSLNKVDGRLEKLNEEEGRYLQVFGKGLSSFEVYEKQIKDLNSRRQSLQIEKQEQKQTTEQVNFLVNLNIADMCKKAVRAIKEFGFTDKQALLRKIINKIVANQELAIVTGYIPLEREELNVAFKRINRDCWDAIRYGIPFELKIKLPPPRKARVITERNKLGVIVHSKVLN
jgi:site-specific DNA recombinase